MVSRISLKKARPVYADKESLTPLKDLGTMGLSDHEVDINQWRLQITG